MARRSLQTLAQAARKALVEDTSTLSKRTLNDVGVFARAIGITPEQFLAYRPSTRAKYIRAAAQGRTAKEERERVRVQRTARNTKPRRTGLPGSVKSDPRWREVKYLQSELAIEGLNTHAGPDTGMDRLGFEELYTDESLVQHIQVYGYDYVLERMRGQYAALRQYNTSGGLNRTIGRDRMSNRFGTLARRDFAASGAVADDDERWYWYHANTLHFG